MALTGGQVGFTGYQQPDYSGVAEAASMPARQMAGMVGQVGDYFKQQGEKKKIVKSASSQIDAALKLMPELSTSLSDVANRIKDENVPLDDRVADAASIQDLIKMSIYSIKNAQMMDIRAAKAGGGGGGSSSNGMSSGGGGASTGGGGQSSPKPTISSYLGI